jgi:hypothetical protein
VKKLSIEIEFRSKRKKEPKKLLVYLKEPKNLRELMVKKLKLLKLQELTVMTLELRQTKVKNTKLVAMK